MIRAWWAGVAFLLSACVQADHPGGRGLPVCEESRRLHCLTPRVCDYDPVRGCQICRCGPPPYRPYPGGPDGTDIVTADPAIPPEASPPPKVGKSSKTVE